MLAERFRLIRALSSHPEASWLGHDEVLDREVVVLALPARDERSRELLAQAGQAGALTHTGLARVYDAGHESRPPRPRAAYVVREWIDGQHLAQLLDGGPLRPTRALELTIQAAQALVALHAIGCVHGRIHPGNVVLDTTGRMHLTDAATSAVRAGVEGGDESADVRDLGAVLYALTTGRWPAGVGDQPAGGLLSAATDAGGVRAPRSLREDVPRALDSLIMRLLRPGVRPDLSAVLTAKNLLVILEQTADTLRREELDAVPPELGPPAPWRRYVPYAGMLAGLIVLATCSYSVGQEIGEVTGTEDLVATIEQDIEASPGPSRELRINLNRAATVRSFDPGGPDNRENPAAVANAFDDEPSTAWTTDRYRTAQFGGLKQGVGLLVDLRQPTAVSRVVLDLTAAGAKMELRAGNSVGASADSLPVIARSTASQEGIRLTLRPDGPAPYRYYLLWFTKLAEDGEQFRAGISEMVALRR